MPRFVTLLPKEKPVRDERYKKFISRKPCSVCGSRSQSDPHHQQEAGNGTMGGKVSDLRCVPLCHWHHEEYNRIGRESFMRKYPWWKPEILIERFNREWDSQQEASQLLERNSTHGKRF